MAWIEAKWAGGDGGIRTLDTLLTYTPLAGERLQPLGHVSVERTGLLVSFGPVNTLPVRFPGTREKLAHRAPLVLLRILLPGTVC